MPIYEYHCKQCGARFDKLVKLATKSSEIECPKCGARKADKAISRLGLTNNSSSGKSLGGSSCGPIG